MREFFKGWKRKLGVVTLGLACAFAAGWVRSYSEFDKIEALGIWVMSVEGYFIFEQSMKEGIAITGQRSRAVPYWITVTPLTILASYLLLSKPRPAHPGV